MHPAFSASGVCRTGHGRSLPSPSSVCASISERQRPLVTSRGRPANRPPGGARFTWGRANIEADSNARRAYVEALHTADGHNYTVMAIQVR